MVDTAQARLCPPYEKICVSLPPQTKKGGTHGQEESRVARRGAARREEEMVGPQDGRQILRPQDHQVEGEGRCGSQAKPAKKARPKQRIAISHHREEDFKADGLRTYAHYRDLGIADATHGLAQAHVIRLIGPCNPAEVSKLHYHDVEFQMVYVLKGWVKTYMEGQGETLMKEGSAWTQPPRIKHLIMDYSDDVELLEVILPAEFKTVELASLSPVSPDGAKRNPGTLRAIEQLSGFASLHPGYGLRSSQ